MKRKSLLCNLLMIPCLLLSGCKDKEEPEPEPEPIYPGKDITVRMDTYLINNKDYYDTPIFYSDYYFKEQASKYRKGLAKLSYGASISTINKERVLKFYEDTEFVDSLAYGYDSETTIDSVGYTFAHKRIDDFDLVAVSFRGFNYGLEWSNNFLIGSSGHHEGIYARGNEVYEALQEYVATYHTAETLKLWINGYSRGGALANMLSFIILDDNKINVTQDNMFTYTFEAPSPVNSELSVAYPNVHNVINNIDLITYIPPESYGLKRCGVDHVIYKSNLSSLAKQFDEHMVIPEYLEISTTNPKLTKDEELRDYILNGVFYLDNPKQDISANSRSDYVRNYQEGLTSFIAYLMSLSSETQKKMLKDLLALGFGLMLVINDATGVKLRDLITPYFDEDGVSYDESILTMACATVIKTINNLFVRVLSLYLGGYKSDIMRIIYMHFPETTYVLLFSE